jgi:hypothetical protein
MASQSVKDHHYAFLTAGIIAGIFTERLIKSGVPPAAIISSDFRPERIEETKGPFGMGGKRCYR